MQRALREQTLHIENTVLIMNSLKKLLLCSVLASTMTTLGWAGPDYRLKVHQRSLTVTAPTQPVDPGPTGPGPTDPNPTQPSDPSPVPTRAFSLGSNHLDFGSLTLNGKDALTVVLHNAGSQPIGALHFDLAAGAYSVTHNCPASLPSNADCLVTVYASAKAIQQYDSELGVSFSGLPVQSIALTGKVYAATATLTPDDSTAFGLVELGTTATRTFTYRASGTIPVTGVQAAFIDGNFATVTANSCGTAAAPVQLVTAGACAITVLYAPRADDTLRATLTVTSSALDSPATLTLTGTSKAPADPYFANVIFLANFNSTVDAQVGNTTIAAYKGVIEPGSGFFGGGMRATAQAWQIYNGANYGDLSGDFTFEGRAKLSTVAGTQRLLSFSTTVAQVTISNGTFYLSNFNGGQWANASAASTAAAGLVPDSWFHWAAVRQGSSVKLFINGKTVATGTRPEVYLASGYQLSIGSQAGAPATDLLKGVSDEVRLTKGVARYTSDFVPQTYPFSNY
jgi:hypothetical protein